MRQRISAHKTDEIQNHNSHANSTRQVTPPFVAVLYSFGAGVPRSTLPRYILSVWETTGFSKVQLLSTKTH
ncbi:hypothetical protein PAXRUDRAFT_828635 [Paxillus rubicundulus Ve08.2h10]|uniref:Unplaced genomic scaffold scaffold_335, whole genome shotgun sequence n=1 Tax=Paxillus rubicundulus Ve08.2h10 TaxID=930991 RepID=A0A0D0DVV7_9AGAM|nr:hypothetical protein PAXRUDRAFT_828635 [Paxillus rubicundulus Ve08.2h10]